MHPVAAIVGAECGTMMISIYRRLVIHGKLEVKTTQKPVGHTLRNNSRVLSLLALTLIGSLLLLHLVRMSKAQRIQQVTHHLLWLTVDSLTIGLLWWRRRGAQ